MKRFVAIVLIVLAGVPWAAFPAAKGEACAMPVAAQPSPCSYCAPAASATSGVPTLEAGCCRFLPKAETVAALAGSIGESPRPLQSPHLVAVVPPMGGVPIPAALSARAPGARGASPPLAVPTRTTHLIL